MNKCGLEGTRTPYLCNANAALYQMSYKPLVEENSLYIKGVGVPGIEPGLHAPHACVLPLYYTPANKKGITTLYFILPQKINFSSGVFRCF